nr:hypothetical protein [Tanacetum cinerariifolium]
MGKSSTTNASLPPEWSKFVTDVELVKDLHTTNYDQLHANLEQQELLENEVRIMRERNQDPLALVANHNMTPSHFNAYRYHTIISVPTKVFTISRLVHNHVPQIEYTVSTVNQQTHMAELPQIDYGLAVLVFKQGDDPIDAINKMMLFLSTVVTSHLGVAKGPVTQSVITHNAAYQADDLDAYDSDCDEISTAKAVLMTSLSSYGSDVLSEDNLIANETLYAELERYKEQIRPMLYDGNVIDKETNVISIADSEETLVLEEESRSKMLLKQKMCNKCLKLEDELIKQYNMVEKDEYNRLSKRFSKLEQHYISFEIAMQLNKETFQKNNTSVNQTEPTFDQLFELNKLKDELQEKDMTIKKLKAHIKRVNETSTSKSVKNHFDEIKTINIELEHRVTRLDAENEHLKQTYKQLYDSIKPSREKVFVITALKNDLRKLKGKDIVDNATTIALGMYKFDPIILALQVKNNREAHEYYFKLTIEQAAIHIEVVEQAKLRNPLDSASYSGCMYVKLIQELLGYVRDTCHDIHKPSEKLVAVTPINKKKTVRFVDTVTSLGNIPKVTNRPLLSFTGVNPSTSASGSKPSGNTKIDRVPRKPSSNEKNKVNVQSRKVKSRLGYNLFSVGQFCDLDLEVAFRKHTCFVHNLEGVNLLSGSQGTNLYSLFIGDMMVSSFISLLSKATKTKSWLWHPRLSHLNFGAINHLARHGLVRGLPRLKFEKDHLCSACAMGKIKKQSHKPKTKDQSRKTISSAHGSLWAYACCKCKCKKVGISHETSVAQTPQQNGIVERRNRTLVEAARTIKPDLSYLYVFGALCYSNNDSKNLGKLQAKADIASVASLVPIEEALAPVESIVEPKTYKDALTPSCWIEAMQEELHEFKHLEVWELVPRPDKVMVITLKWIYKVKLDELGGILKHKSRLVAHGYRQEEGIYFKDAFAPVARLEYVRIFLAFVARMNMIVYHMDVKMAFLNGILRKGVYVSQSNGFVDPNNPNHVYILKKALYGMKQAPRTCRKGKDILLVQIYIDDIIFASTTTTELLDTPMVEKSKLDEEIQGKAVDPTHYRGTVGTLMYLTSSRPDLVYAVYFADADHAGCQDTRRSTSRSMQLLGDRLLADIFTKALCRERVEFLIVKLGMRSFTPETLKELADEAEQ